MVRLLFILSLLLPVSAFAQARVPDPPVLGGLTRDNIGDFLKRTDALSTGQVRDATPDDLLAYFGRHLADNGSFRSLTTYNLAGAPPRDVPVSLNKEQFTASVVQGQGMLKNYHTQIDVKELAIALDGKSAVLKTVSDESGILPVPGGKGAKPQDVPVSGRAVCTQKLVLSVDNYIQMLDADCTTAITLTPKE